jgi:hypothetical protein
VLYVAFFDALMARDITTGQLSFISHHQLPTQNSLPAGGAPYRLFTKHEQSKQALVSLPHAVNFVTDTFTGFSGTDIEPPLFSAYAHIGACTFRLYRLYGVFLI